MHMLTIIDDADRSLREPSLGGVTRIPSTTTTARPNLQ